MKKLTHRQRRLITAAMNFLCTLTQRERFREYAERKRVMAPSLPFNDGELGEIAVRFATHDKPYGLFKMDRPRMRGGEAQGVESHFCNAGCMVEFLDNPENSGLLENLRLGLFEVGLLGDYPDETKCCGCGGIMPPLTNP